MNTFKMNTDGEYRTVSHKTGLFVVGHGLCCPVDSMDIATTLIHAMNEIKVETLCYQ